MNEQNFLGEPELGGAESAEECQLCGSRPGRLTDLAAFCSAGCGALGSSTESERGFQPPPLWGENLPAVLLAREKPLHRAICYMSAQGMTNREIAEALQVSAPTVAYIRKQPWAEDLITQLLDHAGRKKVMAILQGAAFKAAETLVEVASLDGRVSAKPAERAKAANSILDRLYGTAPQTVRHEQIEPSEVSDQELVEIIKSN